MSGTRHKREVGVGWLANVTVLRHRVPEEVIEGAVSRVIYRESAIVTNVEIGTNVVRVP